MKFITLVTTVFLSLVSAISSHGAEEEYVRVLAYEKGTKPSVAASAPKYELRKVADKGTYVCESCLAKQQAPGTTKPSVDVNRNEAFVCMECKHLVWRENGTQVKDSGVDTTVSGRLVEDLNKAPTSAEIKAAGEGTTKPSVQQK